MGFKRIGIIILTTVAIAGCGSSGHFANHPSPPTPVNLTVYINNARVSVSPLREALKDKDKEVREAATYALKKIQAGK